MTASAVAGLTGASAGESAVEAKGLSVGSDSTAITGGSERRRIGAGAGIATAGAAGAAGVGTGTGLSTGAGGVAEGGGASWAAVRADVSAKSAAAAILCLMA